MSLDSLFSRRLPYAACSRISRYLAAMKSLIILPCTHFLFPVTSAIHSSSAHRVCLSSEIDYRPRSRRHRRRLTKGTSPPSYKNWAATNSARPHDVSANRPACHSEELRDRKHTKKRL